MLWEKNPKNQKAGDKAFRVSFYKKRKQHSSFSLPPMAGENITGKAKLKILTRETACKETLANVFTLTTIVKNFKSKNDQSKNT